MVIMAMLFIFDTEVLVKSFENGKYGGLYEFDVVYSSMLPKFDISTIEKKSEDVFSCFIGHKSNVWKHEREHRLLFDKGGECLKIDYRAIKGFVFGCKMNPNDIDYVMKLFSGRNLEYYQVKLKGDSYDLMLEELTDKYPTANKYYPNKVDYDLDKLLEYDKQNNGVGYKYHSFVEKALEEVSREPFVTSISHVLVEDGKGNPNIIIWTRIKQNGLVKKMRSFEYEIIDGALLRVV